MTASLPWGPGSGTVGVPVGWTYGALAVRTPPDREQLVAALRRARFSGWVTPPEGGWAVAVPGRPEGAVASGARDLLELAAWLTGELDATVVAVRVLQDRQLVLAVRCDGGEVGRYVSDPSHGLDDDEGVLLMPLGADLAGGFAAALGVPDRGDDLEELLAEELHPDSVIESERLGTVLAILGLPRWLVSVASLPRDVPDPPRAGAGPDAWPF